MKKWHYPFLAFLIIGTILILTHSRSEAKPEYRTAQGLVFGTSYHITYLYNADLQEDIEQTLALVDNALSMFNPNSTISAVNRSESVSVDDTLFLKVFRRAMEISDLTGGAFDITVAPAVNAWGFGFKHAENIRQATIDSLLEITGYRKIHETDGMIVKYDPRIMLDCSAIAKGFGSDMVANMLPVPVIFFFARKVLEWGADKRVIGKFFTWCLEKGHKGGEKLKATAGRGLYWALLVFVGIPLPGTGAWTGTLAASFLDMDFKKSVAAVMGGVALAGVIMSIISFGVAGGIHALG